jgi:WD40 repeat protein
MFRLLRQSFACIALISVACSNRTAGRGAMDAASDAPAADMPAEAAGPDAGVDPCRPRAPIVQLTYSTDGKRMAIVDGAGDVAVVELTGGLLRRLPLALAGVRLRVALVEDGSVLATASAGTVRLWQVSDGKWVHTLPVGTGDPVSLKFSDSPTPLLLAGFDRQANPADNVRVWRAADGILVGLMTGSPHATFTYADEAVLLLDEAARQYEVRSFGDTVRRQTSLPMPLARTAFAADGAYLGGVTGAGSDDERVAILSVADDQFVWRSARPTRGTRALLFLENPSRVLQLAAEALVYDQADGNVLLPLPALAAVDVAVVSPDGAVVAAVTPAGIVLVSTTDGSARPPPFCAP